MRAKPGPMRRTVSLLETRGYAGAVPGEYLAPGAHRCEPATAAGDDPASCSRTVRCCSGPFSCSVRPVDVTPASPRGAQCGPIGQPAMRGQNATPNPQSPYSPAKQTINRRGRERRGNPALDLQHSHSLTPVRRWSLGGVSPSAPSWPWPAALWCVPRLTRTRSPRLLNTLFYATRICNLFEKPWLSGVLGTGVSLLRIVRRIGDLRHSTDSVCGVARELEQRSVAVGRQV